MKSLVQLQTLLTSGNLDQVNTLPDQHPEVLDEVNEQRQSGFMLIVYSFQSELLQKVQNIKTTYTLHEATVAGMLSEVKKVLTAQPDLP